jgi:alkylresorcinol/alkylpyrone synthase
VAERDGLTDRDVVLADFASVCMQRPVRQEYLLSYFAWLMASARCAATGAASAEQATKILDEVQDKLRRYAIGPNFISHRQFNAFPDSDEALGQNGTAPELPTGFDDILTAPSGPTLDARMRRFETLALGVFRKWYEHKAKAPNALIHVTCSGYAAPSPAQRFTAEQGWCSTSVTHSYHMGCYGAFPAIRTAVGLLGSPILARPEPKHRVDIVHTEYLSAHVATLKDEPGDIVDQTLFGDGFIGYSAYPGDVFRRLPKAPSGLRVLGCHEQMIANTSDEMTWNLGPHQFDMYLSKNVPLLIRDNVEAFAQRLCAAAGLDFSRVRGQMVYAIHPGGPKILDHTRDVLGISEDKVVHSRRVFYELGNMSSATIPHILMEMTKDAAILPGTLILSMGFGPGLTATGTVLQKV